MPKTQKPRKPYPDFPLTAHRNGQWCKKIRGKIHYFGTDANKALDQYLDERDDLQAGRRPGRTGDVTVRYLVNAYLERCAAMVEADEMSPLTLRDYTDIGKKIVEHLGATVDPEQLRPADFAAFRLVMAKQYKTKRLNKIVTVTRQIIKWGHESELFDRKPRFGPDFKLPSTKKKKLERAKKAKKLLTRQEIHKLLEAADPQWKAIILLGINGGLGNTDIAFLKLNDVGGEWLDYPREKTGEDRRIPLWPETQAAISEAIAVRRKPQDGAEDLLFLSKHGGPLMKIPKEGSKTDLTSSNFRTLAEKAGADENGEGGIHRPGMGLYWLRHTFQTIGDGSKDPVAVSSIMGHADNSMAGQYRETIPDDRLLAVTDHVHDWLFG